MLMFMSVYTKWLLKEEDKKIKDKQKQEKEKEKERNKQIELVHMSTIKKI